MRCRHCDTALEHVFLDLGFAPPSNAYLAPTDLHRPEIYFPLKTLVCHECWLVQTEDHPAAHELFRQDYAYFSSTSSSWLNHAARFATDIASRLGLNQQSMVLEVASNDGYLLRNFIAAGIPCLGIEPTDSTASAAERHGIPVIREFFGEALATRLKASGQQADLIVGNNVFAHVPDINDFTRGLKTALKPEGVVTLEFPHLRNLIEFNQFDTIYHEHFSYLSLTAVDRIFMAAGLRVWHVEKLSTHGGSLRVYGCHNGSRRANAGSVAEVLDEERRAGLLNLETYQGFQARADRLKNDLLTFLLEQQRLGKTVAAYGAAAKGNTLLNYAGVRPDLVPFVCDAAVAKQGKYLPGSHIPILPPAAMTLRRPDYILILPWNIAPEIKHQLRDLAARGSRFVTAVPGLSIE